MGEFALQAGKIPGAAELYQRFSMDKEAGEAFEKANLPSQAAEAYTKAGAFESSIKALKDSGQVALASLERGKLLLQQGENLAAAQEFEKGDHHLEAADAFLKANLSGKAARSYLKADRPELAVRLFLEAGEELQALTCYEKMKDFDKAAQLAAHIGLQDRQAYFYEKGGRFIAAAHSHLMIYETEAAVRCLEQVTIDNAQVAEECSQLLESLFEQHRQKEALACAYGLLEGKKANRCWLRCCLYWPKSTNGAATWKKPVNSIARWPPWSPPTKNTRAKPNAFPGRWERSLHPAPTTAIATVNH